MPPDDVDGALAVQSNIRRRSAATASSPADNTSSPSAMSSWQDQLAQARRAMADRMDQEWQDITKADGNGGQPGNAPLEADGVPEGANLRARRTSCASSEGDDDAVVQQLLRPNPSPTAEAVEDGKENPTVPPADEKMCRICFAGEDEEESGKLFSPCLCRGTSRYVHTKCLEQWRKAAPNSTAFYQCPSCAYKYRFRRTTAARLLTNPLTLTLLTSWIFVFLVFLSGFFANSLISVVETRNAAISGNVFDDWFVGDHILVGEGIREAVSFVEHRLEESRWTGNREHAMDRAAKGVDGSEGESIYRFVNPRAAQKAREKTQEPSLLVRAVLHFTKGSALLGIMSVFYSYVAATFVSPLGRTLFRALRPAGGRRRGAENAGSVSQLVIVVLVVLGIIKSVRQVYRGVKWLTRKGLSRVEDLVIEVGAA
ncbi:E3 ubiquitin-protein ligase MARCH5 [Rhodotorula toruloides]|uniref:E3 ubiquitin-protein ligase MARCH5 n=1 Tax=Rhodotorula toruloides TaxID=5286 RepID=A0A511K723_RHOTO|nr:E3 ubiquitin-protein ligase MARCH5 [Rhodotorula toruloides]